MFGHAEHGEQYPYHQLVLNSGAILSLSNKHFIHTAQSPTTLFNQAELKYAQDVSVGEWIWEAGGKMSQVTAVERKLRSGAFNPYTKSGNIIVDGVHGEVVGGGVTEAASCTSPPQKCRTLLRRYDIRYDRGW